ncbi:MAG TPA: efflux transporter periplasmic adaptor subunit [Gammaproteobacteria bacterium]|nr:efflux transporter periplasmic adaptor subunit [Gammaproteobacteria bacterium]
MLLNFKPACLLALALMSTLITSTLYAADKQNWIITVATQSIEAKPYLREFNAVGTAIAQQGVELYPSVSEDVTQVLFEAQQGVKKGDLLIQLESKQEQLALESAQVRLAESTRLMNQYSRALRQNAVPGTDVDAAKAEYQQSKIALAQAQIALDDRQIRAPFDGVVGIPLVDVGDRVSEATLLASIDDRARLYIDFDIPESLVGALQQNQAQAAFSLSTPAFPHEHFKATIKSVENRVDPLKRTLRVRLVLDNNEDRFRPGMSFRIDWLVSADEYPSVPEIALQWGKNGSYIWLLKSFKAVEVPVKVIGRQDGHILVEGEINAGDQVIVEGGQRMHEGLEVCTTQECPDGQPNPNALTGEPLNPVNKEG